ncbi:MAG TPA: OmpH family outer membrane protein [Gemmatimonadaceae bacterium]|nr:OmpH family outer membrane protein [Gemmatimonadaceae bacterium]
MRFFVGMAAVLALLVTGTASAAAQQKFAYINSQTLLQQAPGRAEAEAQFQRELQAYQTEVKRMGDSLKVMVEGYEKEQLVMSPAAKEAKQRELAGKEQEYQQRTAELERKAAAREDELTRPILESIRRAIEAVRAEDGYAFIFDVASNGAVVAVDKNLEVTNEVLAKLRSTASAPPAAPAGGPVAKPAGASSSPTRNPPRNR